MEETKNAASGKAIATFILGLLSLLCLGFLTGIPAIVIGMTEIKAIKEGSSSKHGETLTKIGFGLGITGTSISMLAIIIGLIFVKLGI